MPNSSRAAVTVEDTGFQAATVPSQPGISDDATKSRALLGPRTLHSLEVSLAGLRGMTGFTDPELISVIIALQSFATGIARMEVETTEAAEETGLDHESFWAGQQPYLERAMASGVYPVMAGLADDTFNYEFDHFEFGLERMLDGFEVRVADGEAGARQE
ncbi:hypothetical protein GCM10018773_38600 [Streptomyces candidus]|nr:hypothetical protein GCM10018773_38600 [Streptomyces candidus]